MASVSRILLCIAQVIHSRISFVASAFPNSQSPLSSGPPVFSTGTQCGSSHLLQNVDIRSDAVAQGTFEGAPCEGPWSAIILRLEGSVKGQQFDRYGALWIGDVEVLRTTTPEPTEAGISWTVLRDLTEYASLFLRSQEVKLSIPNTVDSTYTGVLHVNVSVDFYSSRESRNGRSREHIRVFPVLAHMEPTSDPWKRLSIAGNAWQNSTLPRLPRSVAGLFLDVYASGHGCEEFEAGYDCGTPLRRFEVYVNGKVAGFMYPFPVIYTGGVNPLLWRPITGISSFDVPPYRFDLTPFLPLVLTEGVHTLSVRVSNNTAQGSWYVDPVLLCVLGREELLGGELMTAQVDHTYSQSSSSPSKMFASDVSKWQIRSKLIYASGAFEYAVEGNLEAWARYTTWGFPGGPTQPPDHRRVIGRSQGTVSIFKKRERIQKASFSFPYNISLDQHVDRSSRAFDINATVGYAIQSSAMTGLWDNAIGSVARFKRGPKGEFILGTNAGSAISRVLKENDAGGPTLCYNKTLKALDGSITSENEGIWLCGAVLDAAESPFLGRHLPALGIYVRPEHMDEERGRQGGATAANRRLAYTFV